MLAVTNQLRKAIRITVRIALVSDLEKLLNKLDASHDCSWPLKSLLHKGYSVSDFGIPVRLKTEYSPVYIVKEHLILGISP